MPEDSRNSSKGLRGLGFRGLGFRVSSLGFRGFSLRIKPEHVIKSVRSPKE